MFAAVDKHTRIGKRYITRFAKEVSAIKHFFDKHSVLNPVTVLGASIFIVEGIQLNRWVIFDGDKEIHNLFVKNYLEYAGVNDQNQNKLLKLIKSSLSHLNQIRAEEMT